MAKRICLVNKPISTEKLRREQVNMRMVQRKHTTSKEARGLIAFCVEVAICTKSSKAQRDTRYCTGLNNPQTQCCAALGLK